MRLSLLLTTAALLAAPTPSAVLRAQQPMPTPTPIFPQQPPLVVTTGHGEVRVAPDRATVLVSVETRGETAAAAAADNATRQQRVMDALVKSGIPKERISTVEYNVYPEQVFAEGKPPRVSGYAARSTVRVEVRKIDQVGPTIDTALGAGATSVNQVEFDASNVDQARREALAKAIEQARGDAEAMARAAGGTLGALVDVIGGGPMPPPRPMFDMAMQRSARAMEAAATPINPGEFLVATDVQVRWQFVPGGR